MSERGAGKSRKSPASKAMPSKQPAPRGAASKKASAADTKARGRAAGRSKSPANPAAAEGASAPDAGTMLARIAKLESERDRLRGELEKAEIRIRALEEGRDQVLNRIDWVIDSLKSLIEGEQ